MPTRRFHCATPCPQSGPWPDRTKRVVQEGGHWPPWRCQQSACWESQFRISLFLRARGPPDRDLNCAPTPFIISQQKQHYSLGASRYRPSRSIGPHSHSVPELRPNRSRDASMPLCRPPLPLPLNKVAHVAPPFPPIPPIALFSVHRQPARIPHHAANFVPSTSIAASQYT
ncbi:hypothetical protein COCSADRAFT_302221 [Bipolaris sorokiniana ND90Pr]|uniref:Uncharacterized protein n=1 Tax=Cochliobolus sativus (strain ND90Pr / ATCC 201652) TaxID=665912 RepID=M2TC60_COCSN|nr:uncharacterized protein COCSADRAFT_302221 [Bipolaris sorokiniana ND90Pr]EMD66786.1 hypothetical protein COCSADRAFT_302221 [Bipolaris sorokiniana ND90Pr]